MEAEQGPRPLCLGEWSQALRAGGYSGKTPPEPCVIHLTNAKRITALFATLGLLRNNVRDSTGGGFEMVFSFRRNESGRSINYVSDHIWQFQIKNKFLLQGYRLPSISFVKRKKGIKRKIWLYKLPCYDLLIGSRFFLFFFFLRGMKCFGAGRCGIVWI